MIEISKEEGKKLLKIKPNLVSTTSHRRHYYAVECNETYRLLKQIREGK